MKIPEVFLSKEDRNLLNDSNLIFAGSLFAYERWRESVSRQPRLRTTLAMNGLFLITNHTYSIQTLVESGQIRSAKALLRLVVEIYLNINYVYSTKDLSAAVRYGYGSDKHYIDNLEKYRAYTNATYLKPFLSNDDFDALRKDFDKSLQDWQKYGYPLRNMPDLRARVEAIQNATKNDQAGRLYFNSYLLLSEDVHTTASQLASVSVTSDFEERWFGQPQHKEIRDILAITNEVLCSCIVLIENRTGKRFSLGPLPRKTLRKYNRYIKRS
jgi:hypothetical protein